MGITNSGVDAQDDFCNRTGFIDLKNHSRVGDVEDPVYGYRAEVKEAAGGTANQVRPCKAIVLVVRDEEGWYVMSLSEQCKLALRRSGQHGVSSFENMTIPKGIFRSYKVADKDLAKEVRKAAKKDSNKLAQLNVVFATLRSKIEAAHTAAVSSITNIV